VTFRNEKTKDNQKVHKIKIWIERWILGVDFIFPEHFFSLVFCFWPFFFSIFQFFGGKKNRKKKNGEKNEFFFFFFFWRQKKL